MLAYLGDKLQIKNIVVVPVSFVSEHIETLEEIDMEYREIAAEHGISEWRRVPALNTDQGFIDDLADLVVEALESPCVSIAEAASISYATDMTQWQIQAAATSSAMSDSNNDNNNNNNSSSNNNNNNNISQQYLGDTSHNDHYSTYHNKDALK
jgi:hypothetical protein